MITICYKKAPFKHWICSLLYVCIIELFATKYASNTTLTSFVLSPSIAKKIAKIARFTQAAFLRKQTRYNGRMIYTDINTPIAARCLPIFLPLFFRAGRAADTSLRRSQRNRVAPTRRRNITPLWQPRILVRCRFGGEEWRASHWPPQRIA